MNRNEFKDLNYDWDEEKRRRLRYIRQAKTRLFLDTVINALMALSAIVLIVLICWHVSRRDVEERAAYNEGYYGVDRATAVAMAERGIGKSASVVLAPREHISAREARAVREVYE